MRVAILGTLGVLLTVLAYVGRHDFRAQSIPLDSLYVLGIQGEEMTNYTVDLQEGSGVRIWWNMNTVSTRDGYAIYCGLRRNGAGYEMVPPQDDRTERPMVSTTYDFACRSCKGNTQTSCFTSGNTDYITTYERTFSVKVPGSPAAAPSSRSAVASQSFLVEGTQGERPSGTALTLRAGSDVRLAWNISPETNSVYYYSIYCGMKKDGGVMEQVPLSYDATESVDRQRSYELICRNCRNWKDYDGYVDPIVPWNNCWAPTNIDFQETFKKQYVVQRINVCGDGILGSSETCDDANVAGGDGCSASCQTEPSYRCTGTTCVSIACNDGIDNDGDGLIDAQENREPATHLFGDEAQIRTYLNGISALITPDPLREREFLCPNYAQISTKKDPSLPVGQVRLADEEEMKDTAADKFCRLFQWDEAITVSCVGRGYDDLGGIWGTWQGEQMIRGPVNYANYSYYNAIRCAVNPDCGDREDNDFDGNIDYPADPGCTNVKDTSEHSADSGCTSPTDPSEGGCGDGRKEAAEQCDDGNVKAGDGCSATCILERGAAATTGTATSAGNTPATSSRSSLAAYSTATTTAPAPKPSSSAAPKSSVSPNRCGDGMRGNAEECDDGNLQNGDGCSATCLFEGLPPPRSSVRSVAFVISSLKPAAPTPPAPRVQTTAVSSARQSAAAAPAPQTLTASSVGTAPQRAASSATPLPPVPAVVSSPAGNPLPALPVAVCGNGRLEGREQCDRGTQNALAPNADCRPDCTFGRCGDGILDPATEQCDDGRYDDGDGCSSRCLWEIHPSVSSVMYGTPLAKQPMPLLFLDPTSPPKTASSLPTLPQSQPENPPVMQPIPPTPPEHPAAPPFVMEQQSSPPIEAIPYVEPEMRMPYDETQPPAPLQEAPLASSSSSSAERTSAQQHGFSVWHLPMLRPDIFPTLRSAEEALLFVEQNICTSSPAEVVPYLPYFRCKQVQSGFEGSLTGMSAGSASLGVIAGLLLTGIAWVRMRRAR